VGRAISTHKGRVVARSLTNITGAVLSMHLSWSPVTQLYTRHMYALISSMWALNCLVVLTEGAINEVLFCKGLPRLRFAGPLWPPTGGGRFGWRRTRAILAGEAIPCKAASSTRMSTSLRRIAGRRPHTGNFSVC
jgi:hypothetical protein